jgi:16S rRNA (guanine966-N2)-methyltransferase
MRVIAGTHRGRRLVAPDTSDTRPVADRVKESIFSSLGTRVVDAVVADLYAGAGSFGIEALSRGATSVVFVESGRKALAALASNLGSLQLEARVVSGTVERFLLAPAGGHFDLVFCDPPWPLASDTLGTVLEQLWPLLRSGALVVLTRRAGDPVPRPEGYEIDDQRRMGDTRIIRYAKMEAA